MFLRLFCYCMSGILKTTIYSLVYVVVQLVEALCYKLEGNGFDSQWGCWDFSLT